MMQHFNLIRQFMPRGFLQETWRDPGEQLRLYGLGRDEHGNVVDKKKVVTNAKPGLSWHNLTYHDGKPASFAYHVAIRDEDGVGIEGFGRNTLSAKDKEDYLFIGRLGEHLGLTWGGRWKSEDLVHFEYRIAALSNVRAALHAGENISVLRETRA
jgi:hypothetical protein